MYVVLGLFCAFMITSYKKEQENINNKVFGETHSISQKTSSTDKADFHHVILYESRGFLCGTARAFSWYSRDSSDKGNGAIQRVTCTPNTSKEGTRYSLAVDSKKKDCR